MSKFTYIAAAAIAATSFGLSGCDDADMTLNDRNGTSASDVRDDGGTLRDDARAAGERMEDAAQTAGDKLESAADKTGDAIRDGADSVGDAAHDATHDDPADMTPDPADRGGPTAGTATHDESVASDDSTMAPNGTDAAPDAEGIRDVLASSTEAALTKGGFDDLIERLVDADRNRIGEFAEQDMTELDGLVAAIQEQWQAKYGQEFDISNEELVFNESFQIQQSEIGEQARTASDADGIDVDANADASDDGATADVDIRNNTSVDTPGEPAADRNLNDPGRNTATVSIPASHGLPQLTLNFIHELPDAWRLDVPDSLDGQKLQQNLKDHLTQVKDSSAEWPADVNDAYRLVSHHLFMALNDQPATMGAGGM